jgi:hypothetical protein
MTMETNIIGGLPSTAAPAPSSGEPATPVFQPLANPFFQENGIRQNLANNAAVSLN